MNKFYEGTWSHSALTISFRCTMLCERDEEELLWVEGIDMVLVWQWPSLLARCVRRAKRAKN